MVAPASFARADVISKEYQLPRFFKNKLRLDANHGSKDEILKVMAEIFAASALIAKNCRYNPEEIHEYSEKGSDAQISRFPFLSGRSGQMPNPVWSYAESYAHYKKHRKESHEIKKIKAKALNS